MQLKTRFLAGGALAVVLATVSLVQAQAQAQTQSSPPAQPSPGYGYGYGCPGGYGMMGPGMMGPGMMGYGMGPGMMGYGYGSPGQQGRLNLSVNDVRTYLERWVAMNGNPHVKVGAVAQRDANTIVGDIITKDGGSLVQRFAFDRTTGALQNVQ
ncbi:hypothetical protein [Phenylobacterium soli]|uniref:hypothetical protein n=1 Tax=Phenylobacterium soli TaxID=2170551 RepID=UPI0018740FF4|nr:hypothetical protein [Phenylobacterium soli]